MVNDITARDRSLISNPSEDDFPKGFVFIIDAKIYQSFDARAETVDVGPIVEPVELNVPMFHAPVSELVSDVDRDFAAVRTLL